MNPRMWTERDSGLRLAVSLAADDLEALRAYFTERHDITEGGLPNEEMKLALAVQRVASLHARILAGNPGHKIDYHMAIGGE